MCYFCGRDVGASRSCSDYTAVVVLSREEGKGRGREGRKGERDARENSPEKNESCGITVTRRERDEQPSRHISFHRG